MADCPVCGAASPLAYRKGRFLIHRCGSCRTLFVGNPPEDTSAIYTDEYFFGGGTEGGYVDYDREKDAMRRTLIESLERIEAVKPLRGRLLDVGAATGYFLALAQERGWEVRGVELSPQAAAKARERGIEVAVGTLSQAPFDKGSFDAVTAFDVIEHVADPGALAREIAAMLGPGGALFGSTPDSLSLNARISGKGWHMLFPPEHLTLMNERSLRLLLEKAGFRVLWMGKLTKRFTPQYILSTASRWLKLPLLGRLSARIERTPLSKLAIPLDLRDNLFFLAIKR